MKKKKMKIKIAGNIIILHVYQKPQSYEVQFLRSEVRQIFLVILGHFLHFYPTINPEN